MILILIAKAFYFMLPAYFSNMAPVIMKNSFRRLAVPVDSGKRLAGKEIFGSHKTYRGIVFGIAFGILAAFFQYALYSIGFFKEISLVDYNHWAIIGFLLGAGAIAGDLVESFFKRRIGIPSGKAFIPFDQVDFVIGALVFISFYAIVQIDIAIVILAISFVLDVAVNHFSFYLGLRKEKW